MAAQLDRTSLARAVFDVAHITGTFRLRSGVTSNEYFDKYLFEADPALLHQLATAMAPLVPTGTEALAGLELGGVPLATLLSHVTGLPCRFVRKKAKEYGTEKLAEGGAIGGQKLCVVEDVVTSGGQIIESCAALRADGAEILAVLCVIDREAGGVDNLAAEDLPLTPLFTMSELKAAAAQP
jgi:orotate phosphoribosyltransferase